MGKCRIIRFDYSEKWFDVTDTISNIQLKEQYREILYSDNKHDSKCEITSDEKKLITAYDKLQLANEKYLKSNSNKYKSLADVQKYISLQTIQADKEVSGMPEYAKLDDINKKIAYVDTLFKLIYKQPDEQHKESKTNYKTPDKSLMALDKLNDIFWQQQQIIPGENYVVNTAKNGTPEIGVIFSIEKTEENSGVLSKLSPFDRRVYQAVSTFRHYYPKMKLITGYNIYKFMHDGGTPNSDDIKKIEKSLLLLTSTPFTYDCSAEAEAGYNYDFGKIKESSYKASEALLLGRVVSQYTQKDGGIIGCALNLDAVSDNYMPILTDYAIKHKQCTMIPVNVLQTAGINGSDKNYKLTDYMISRVQHARRKNDSVKILYSTIYKNIGDTERKQKSRTRERIEKILKDWRTKKFIDSFKINKSSSKVEKETGVTIYF